MAAFAAVTVGLLALAAYAAAAPDFVATGDLALIESYTQHAAHGNAFLGPYSRYLWNHPGPLYFYSLVPVYELSGEKTAALLGMAALLNGAALVAAVRVAFRRAAMTAFSLAAVGLVYVWRITETLATAWNPHVLALPLLLLIVCAAALASGTSALLKWVAALATFIVQTHVGTAPTTLAVVALAVGMGWMSRGRTAADGPAEWNRQLLRSAIVMAVLWALPAVEQFRAGVGNGTELWRFFVEADHAGPRAGLTDSTFSMWAALLGGVFSADFGATTSGTLRMGAQWWTPWWAIAQVALVSAATWRAARANDRFRTALGALLLVATFTALWSITRIVDDIMPHAIFWVSAIGALNGAFLIDALVVSVRGPAAADRPRALIAIACVALSAAVSIHTVQQLRIRVERLNRPSAIEELTALRLWQTVSAYRSEHPFGKPLIRIQQPTWPVAAGVVLQLQKSDIPFAIEDAWLPMFSDAVRSLGDEESTLTFARPDLRQTLAADPTQREIAQRDGIHVFLKRR